MSIQIVRTILLADPTTQEYVGDRIGALRAELNEQPPFIVLTVSGSEAFNTLGGWAGLNRTEIELTAWAFDYATALAVANAARTAIEAAGNYTISEPGDEYAFQQDVALYAHRFVFAVFDSDD